MVLPSVRCLLPAAPGLVPGDCVKHAALPRFGGVAREKLNGGNTTSFNPQGWLSENCQP
jgi:hypothetical protein